MKCNYHKTMKDQGTFCSFCLTWESFNIFTLFFFSMYTFKKKFRDYCTENGYKSCKEGTKPPGSYPNSKTR